MDRAFAASACLAFLGILALAVIVSGGARAANDPPYTGGTVTGDWTVTDMRSYHDVSITLRGNLAVVAGGTLVLDETTLYMDSQTLGQYGIEVRPGGTLVMQGGAGVWSTSAARYSFAVRPGGVLTISSSEVHRCGYRWGAAGETAGLFIESDSCNLTDALIADGDCGVVVRGASPVFTDCRFSGNAQGCVVINSSSKFSDCTFQYNQNGANLDNWSGTFTDCTFAYNTGFGLLSYGSSGNITGCDLVANGAGDCVLVGSRDAVSNCTFRDSLYGLYIDEGGPRISNCTVTGNRYGVHLFRSAPVFSGCAVTGSSLVGLSCLQASPSLSDCTISRTGYSPRDGFYWGRGIILYDSELTFDGGRLSENYFALEARYSGLSVSNVNFTQNAVGLFASWTSVSVTGCAFLQNLQIGAHLTDSSTGAFERCSFTCETQGAAFDRQTSARMGNSTFLWCREGLKITDCDERTVVIGCDFENNSLGAALWGSSCRVLSCDFAFNVNYSLNASGGAAEIRGCTFRECPKTALTLDSCAGFVDGNSFESIDATGLYCQNTTVEISNNTFRNGRGTAVHSYGEDAAPDIHDNLFDRNGLGVAFTQGSGGRIHHNSFTRNEQAGISLGIAHGEIFCNTVSGSVHGISCIMLSDAFIHDNEVFGNEGGILVSDSSNATVTRNSAHHNSQFGIQARMAWPALEDNLAWENQDGFRVVWCLGPSPVLLDGNRAWNNTLGLFAQGSNLELEGGGFSNNSMAGVRLIDCQCSVLHVVFDSNRDGLSPDGGSLLARNCDFLDNNNTGIITDGADATVDGCYFRGNTDGALDLGNSTIRFVDGVFESNIATGFYCQWSTDASWTVGRTSSAGNCWFALRGNLTVLGGGSLRLVNSTLSMRLEAPGQFSIEVRSGGRLEMLRGSRVEAADPDGKYPFRVLAGGNLTIEEGTLQDCGGEWGAGGRHAGLAVMSGACALRDVLFLNCTFGLVADGIAGDFEYLTFSGCDYAVIAISSKLRLDNCTVRLSGSMDLELRQGSSLTLVNTTFDRERASLLDQQCSLEVYWYLGIGIAWQNDAVVEGALLELADAANDRMLGGLSDERGFLMWVPVLEYRQNSLSIDDRNPYDLSVSKAGMTWERKHTFKESVYLPVTLYDLAPPAVQVDFPRDGSVLNRSSAEFGGRANDNETGLATVEWKADGGAWQPANGTAQWSFLAALEDGAHAVVVRATDAAGNRASTGLNITVKTRLGLELSGPVEGLLTRVADLAVSGTTESGASVRVNGQAAAVVSGNFTATVRLAEGPNIILFEASDLAGNTAALTRTVVLDTTPPFIDLASPANGSYTNVRETTVSGRTEPGAKVLVNGQVLINSGGRFSLAVALDSDANVLSVTAIDPAGNQNTTLVTVLVDTVAPSIGILSPRAGHHTLGRGITIRGTTEPYATVSAWDRSAVAGADGSFLLNVTLFYGNNTLLVKSTDRAGNANTVDWSVVRDRPAAGPGSPWAAALAALCVWLAVQNAAILAWRRRRSAPGARSPANPAGAPVAARPPARPAPEEAAVPEARAEPVPPEALPVGDDEPLEMVDMK
jgi:parallel beta-helix repeat protein